MRFKLSTLMLGILVVAIYAGIIWRLPSGFAAEVLDSISALLGPVCLVAAFYGSGPWRAFFLGCVASLLMPATTPFYSLIQMIVLPPNDESVFPNTVYYDGRVISIAQHLRMILSGLVSVVIWRFYFRNQTQPPTPTEADD